VALVQPGRMLDVLAMQLRRLDPFVRTEVMTACRALVGRVQNDYEEYKANKLRPQGR
jgi:hypothetical protein